MEFSRFLNSPIIPSVSRGALPHHLSGTFAPGIAPYTNVTIDVYQLDLQGWTNGQKFALSELTANSTKNGFPQGSKYLGSFSVANNGTFDADLTLGWLEQVALSGVEEIATGGKRIVH